MTDAKWYSKWNTEEMKYLEEKWLTMTASEIGNKLGRTKN